MRLTLTTKSLAAGCHPWVVWALFGMVLVLTLINVYQGLVIADQMREIRALYETRLPH